MRKPFNDVLASYVVMDADKALLERVLDAADAEATAAVAPPWMSRQVTRISMTLTACAAAVLGLWLGTSIAAHDAVDTGKTPAEVQQPDYLDTLIIGPRSADEMTL